MANCLTCAENRTINSNHECNCDPRYYDNATAKKCE